MLCAAYKKRNQVASEILELLVESNWYQRFCDAFDVDTDKETRELKDRQWFATRRATKELYKHLHKVVHVWADTADTPKKEAGAMLGDAINIGLFGKTAKQIREELGLEGYTELTRDHFGETALYHIRKVEEMLMDLEDKLTPDTNPTDWVDNAIERLYPKGVNLPYDE